MKKFFAVGLMLGFFGAVLSAHADKTRVTSGPALTYLLNGSPVYLGTIGVSDGGFADNSTTSLAGASSFSIDNTAFIMTQCNEHMFVINSPIGNVDGGTTGPRSVKVSADVQNIVGALQPGVPYISVAAGDAGIAFCKVFELK